MNQKTIIEIFHEGRWQDAATLDALGPDRCRVDYLPQYQFSANPLPLSLGYPLDTPPDILLPKDGQLDEIDRRPPGFLYDLVPQGRGRQFLLKKLNVADGENIVMPLLMAGAFNPIGNLRIKSAVEFYAKHVETGAAANGFGMQDILAKSEEFLEHLSMHAMLATGTTGVQGVAPKYLLTQDSEGLWFADLALPDDRAEAHWLVKLPRGRAEEDRMVLRNEAAYLRVAHKAGLRTHDAPMLHNEMLFVRRFDREVTPAGLNRLHQESLVSLAGIRGFGVPMSMNEMLAAIRAHVSEPLGETIEFLKRDAMNVALRNTDNHARNTAVQRLADGHIQLTPVFDFAPMFLDPEIVPRTSHWIAADGKTRLKGFGEVLDLLATYLPADEVNEIARRMKEFAKEIERLPDTAQDQGVERNVIDQCLSSIERVFNDLDAFVAPEDLPIHRTRGEA